MKKILIALMLTLLVLIPIAALAEDGAAGLPDEIMNSLTENTAFRDYDIISWAEISDTGYIFVSLNKETRNRLVVYKFSDTKNAWAYSFYSDTAMASGNESYIEDASGTGNIIDGSECENAVMWSQRPDDGESFNHAVCAELKKGKWYVASYSTDQPKPAYINITSSGLTYYNQYSLKKYGKANGVFQNELRYFSLSALPKTLSEAYEKLSNPPTIPTGSFTVQNVKFNGKEKYDVYSGPGWDYYRAANGKAAVSTNDWIQVFGREGDWLLIEYAISDGQMRFGYISYSAVGSKGVSELNFVAISEHTGKTTALTDDPLGKKGTVLTLAENTEIKCLANMGDWMYVECENGLGQTTRGFIPLSAISYNSNTVSRTAEKNFGSYTASVTFGLGYTMNVTSNYRKARGLGYICAEIVLPANKTDIVAYRLYYNNTLLTETSACTEAGSDPRMFWLDNVGVTTSTAGTLGLCPVYSDGSVKTDEMLTITLE